MSALQHQPLSIDNPAMLMQRLLDIENDMAIRQNDYELVAEKWHGAQREIRKRAAEALLTADERSVTEKKARGELAGYDVEDADTEGEYEATKAALDVLTKRSIILMAVLKGQGRA